jgi:hypothetical protein
MKCWWFPVVWCGRSQNWWWQWWMHGDMDSGDEWWLMNWCRARRQVSGNCMVAFSWRKPAGTVKRAGAWHLATDSGTRTKRRREAAAIDRDEACGERGRGRGAVWPWPSRCWFDETMPLGAGRSWAGSVAAQLKGKVMNEINNLQVLFCKTFSWPRQQIRSCNVSNDGTWHTCVSSMTVNITSVNTIIKVKYTDKFNDLSCNLLKGKTPWKPVWRATLASGQLLKANWAVSLGYNFFFHFRHVFDCSTSYFRKVLHACEKEQIWWRKRESFWIWKFKTFYLINDNSNLRSVFTYELVSSRSSKLAVTS